MASFVRIYKNTESIFNWALRTLTPEELEKFNSDFLNSNNKWSDYINRNLIVNEKIYQSVYSNLLNTNIDIQIGERSIVSDGVDPSIITLDPSWSAWIDRFNQDSNYSENIIFEP
jgi:hypothetical protein